MQALLSIGCVGASKLLLARASLAALPAPRTVRSGISYKPSYCAVPRIGWPRFLAGSLYHEEGPFAERAVVHGHATLEALAVSRTASAMHGAGKRARSAGAALFFESSI
jgi:hypothetical protein